MTSKPYCTVAKTDCDFKASEQQPGKTAFWVFHQSHETVNLGTASAEPHGQHVAWVRHHTAPDGPTSNQTAITDFFSPRPSVSPAGGTRRLFAPPPFITPCPSVRLAEVPYVFQVQSECVVDNYLDLTRPLFACEVSKTSSELSSSSPASPKEAPSKSSWSPSDPAATELIGTSQAEDQEKKKAEEVTEKYWIEKDQERLEVIANMEKTMAETKGELVNTATALQMASGANLKLQAVLEKKTTSLSEMEEDRIHLVHSLDAKEIDFENLKKELALNRRYRKHHLNRAEEALASIQANPSKEAIAKVLQAKAEAESLHLVKVTEMETEIDFLKSQLEERCNSEARLTKSLSRVADFDRWKIIKQEMEEVNRRANKLPDQLHAAQLECEKWKGQYKKLWKKHEKLILDQASLEQHLHNVKEFNLKLSSELKRDLMNKAARSERAFKECIKQVFERMVRCSLCLEIDGYLPFNNVHREICAQVLKLTGKDYQQALCDYYDDHHEHDIREEFISSEGDDEEEDEDEGGQDLDNRGQTGDEGSDRQENYQDNEQEYEEGRIANHYNADLHTSDLAAGPADTAHDSSSDPTEDNNVVAAAAKDEEVQESPETQEAPRKPEVVQTEEFRGLFPTAAGQAMTGVTGPPGVARDPGYIASSDVVQTLDVLSSGRMADNARSRTKKQAFSGHQSSVPASAANAKPESGEGFTFSKPFSMSKPVDATSLSTSASGDRPDFGRPFAFGFGKDPSPLFATPTAGSEANSGEGPMSPKHLGNSKSAGVTNPSTPGKGNSQDIWKGVPFATAKNKPFPFKAVPAVDLEAKSNGKAPVFKSFSIAQPAEAKAPVFENLEAKQGNETTKAQNKVASGTTKESLSPPRLQEFNFGGNSSPVAFTSSSPSFPTPSTQPTSTGIFSLSRQNPPLVATQAKEKVSEDSAAKFENLEEEISNTEAPKVEVPKEKALEEKKPEGKQAEETSEVDEPEPQGQKTTDKESSKKMPRVESASKKDTPKEDTPKENPTVSEPSRNQKRLAMKEQKKAAKKAENEANNAKAQASRRVQQAMMMG